MRGDKDTDIKAKTPGVMIEPGQIASGASFSGGETNHFWLNHRGQDFIEQSGISGADSNKDARTFSLLDYDRDGYQDFVIVNANRPFIQLFRNRIGDLMPDEKRLQPLRFRFVGGNRTAQPSSEWGPRTGFGAKVRLTAGDVQVLREYRGGEGLGGQNSPTMLVGIGSAQAASGVKVEWPNGKVTQVGTVPAGTLVTVYENPADSPDGSGFSFGSLAPAGRLASDSVRKPKLPDLGHSPMLARLAEGKTEARYRLFMSWFVDCAACKRASPKVAAISEHFADDELAIFGFNNESGDSKKEQEGYRDRFQPAYIMLTERTKDDIKEFKRLQDTILGQIKDPKSGEMNDASQYTPGCIITDADGNILWIDAGMPSYSEIKKLIRTWEGYSDF